MTDVRVVQRVQSPDPTLPSHLATKNYVDLAAAPHPTDTAHYGDLVSSARREDAVNQLTLNHGYWTFSSFVAPKSITATKVRFFIATAAEAAGSSSVALHFYDDGAQVATAPVVPTTFTAGGIKELTLSAPITVGSGRRYTWLLYIAANSYTSAPSLACTEAGFAGLLAPSAALTFTGFKAAAASPPASITTGDGTWNALATTPWWALL